MLYSIYADSDTYRDMGFDDEQMTREYGALINHFSVNYSPKAFSEIMKGAFNVNFSREASDFSGDEIPEISEHYGRLFLGIRAYEALKDLLKNDGEFLPVKYEQGDAYIFNPLSLAESVDGLDTKLCAEDDFGDITNIGFHKERVKNFNAFKTNHDNYINLYIQEEVKRAIEDAGLKGVFFTPDLGQRFSLKFSNKMQSG